MCTYLYVDFFQKLIGLLVCVLFAKVCHNDSPNCCREKHNFVTVKIAGAEKETKREKGRNKDVLYKIPPEYPYSRTEDRACYATGHLFR